VRLWTLHPHYLDPRGLVALWREALLAQAVLTGRTRGYTRHPQLIRFRETPSPAASIASYLSGICSEAARRGYCFDATRICPVDSIETIAAPQGQLDYEWDHLMAKLRVRSPLWLAGMGSVTRPDPHPLFRIVPGPVASWEVLRPKAPYDSADSSPGRA